MFSGGGRNGTMDTSGLSVQSRSTPGRGWHKMSSNEKPLSVAEELAAIREQLKTLFVQNLEIKDLLHGDGKTGLVSRVTALETRLDGMGQKVDDNKTETSTRFSWIAWAVTTLVAAYAAFVKHPN
jgi:hypothetical protein